VGIARAVYEMDRERWDNPLLWAHRADDREVLDRIHKSAPNVVNGEFIKAHTEGEQGFHDFVMEQDWEAIERASGVERAAIERVAQLYARSKATIFAWTMGITHHVNGSDN